uniref:Uncharacterized protein n=1 Tax=Anguilla anguilla TaxID=7936 RepID=A0A0E9RFI8_ANGAN
MWFVGFGKINTNSTKIKIKSKKMITVLYLFFCIIKC